MSNLSAGDTARLISIACRAMREHGLAPEFDDAVAKQMGSMVHAATEPGPAVCDLRDLLWASIDNDSSRDLDQLSVAVPAGGDQVRILVAVADVDALVKIDSPIDGHARANTTSVYTAATIFPMLPERLSTDLTSLGEGQERLAIVIDMSVDTGGAVTKSGVYRAAVLNRAKLAYGSVGAWLEGRGAAPPRLAAVDGIDQQLRIQDKAAQALGRARHARGALNLQTIEAQPVTQSGVLSDLRPDENNRAKQLIEELMVAANGVTAQFLAAKGFASLRRVLRTPKRWDRICALAAELGERLPTVPSAPALNAFLDRRRQSDPARFGDLSLSVVKLLGAGEYVLDKPGQIIEGHFGLAVSDYTHSTAPNRRFPDLITQRLLKAALAGERPPYTEEELSGLAAHCTEQEKNAAKVERSVNKSAAALLLAPRIGLQFDAIVTGASEKGTWVRISAPTTEGRLTKGLEGLDVGDRVRVKLIHADAERGFIDFARA